jgi:inosose dehydratase
MGLMERVAAAPISWGVCEVPGWGRMLPAHRVLAEMAALGFRGTELGAPGFLPDEPGPLRTTLDAYGLGLVGGFVALVLHDPAAADAALAQAEATAALFAAAGGQVFVTAAVVDQGWSPRIPLEREQWRHMGRMLARVDAITGRHGLVHVLHPHAGTLVESADDIARVAEHHDVRWCLDTGHLGIGGVDPAAFARDLAGQVGHVHLKDADLALAHAVGAGDLSLLHAVQRGLFRPLGQGDLPIADVVVALEGAGYTGRYVLEQDTAITGDEPPEGTGPIDDVRLSLDSLRTIEARVPT